MNKKKPRTKRKISCISLILILTISATAIASHAAFAQDSYREKTTYAIIGATPNPVGVNQPVLLHIGITDYLVTVTDGWENLTVSVERPDGETEILGPFTTDATGGTGHEYTPTMAGTYKLQTHFPAQFYTWVRGPSYSTNIFGTILYKASVSEVLELVVTEEQREYYPDNSLPTEYWSRPIDAQLREWSSISGNWLSTAPNMVAPYNDDAPETSHILWAKEMQMGGLAGGATGDHAFECGDAYEGLFSSSVIIGGNLYYNHYKSAHPTQQVVAVNLHTGEELWVKPLTTPDGDVVRLSFGQVFYWDSYNYHAAFPYLWGTSGTTWHAFDPFDGQYVYSMENVPSGTNLYGPKGEIYRYTVNLGQGSMTLWNSSRVVSSGGSWISGRMGSTFDATNGIEWTVDIPTGLPGSVVAVNFEDRLVGNDAAAYVSMGDLPINTWAINLKPGHEGELIFNSTWTPPTGDLTTTWGTRYSGAPSFEDGVYVLWLRETCQLYGFDLDTGEEIWGPTKSQTYLDYLGITNIIAEGVVFSGRMGGIVYAYNVTTGEYLWEYVAEDPYTEILWSNNWPMRPLFVTDGKIYYGHSEHSPVDPKPRGAPFVCIDIETGEEVWRIDGAFRVTDWGGLSIIGDSIIATYNSYDQRVYAIGKGASETTVSISDDVVTLGNPALVKGSVTDVSPGTHDATLEIRFPNGVPAVSTDSMNDWMKYVYMQFEKPTDVEGVPVKIQIIDPDGEYSWIGTPTSNSYGKYSFSFSPQKEGTYTIIATFDGSEAYYGSEDITYLTVGPAVDVPGAAEIAETTVNQMPTFPTVPDIPAFLTIDIVILVIAAVGVVIGLIAYMALRKQQ
ncbi:MAG: PQQ-binding-like beta-propeller repeat protein [Candidatus Bathyarchaeota archaeon]|jgi:hypothetical protein